MRARLPTVLRREVAAMEAHLIEEYGSRRRPTTAAKLLVLIVKLDSIGQPFATRMEVAKHLGLSSPFGIDAAIGTAKERELIEEKVAYFRRGDPRRLAQHVISRRYFIPSSELKQVVASA